MAQLKDIIKSWAWSAPAVVDIFMLNGFVYLMVGIEGAWHQRKWSIT